MAAMDPYHCETAQKPTTTSAQPRVGPTMAVEPDKNTHQKGKAERLRGGCGSSLQM